MIGGKRGVVIIAWDDFDDSNMGFFSKKITLNFTISTILYKKITN